MYSVDSKMPSILRDTIMNLQERQEENAANGNF